MVAERKERRERAKEKSSLGLMPTVGARLPGWHLTSSAVKYFHQNWEVGGQRPPGSGFVCSAPFVLLELNSNCPGSWAPGLCPLSAPYCLGSHLRLSMSLSGPASG